MKKKYKVIYDGDKKVKIPIEEWEEEPDMTKAIVIKLDSPMTLDDVLSEIGNVESIGVGLPKRRK